MEVGRLNFAPITYRTVGFDQVLNEIDSLFKNPSADKYPPHNIIRLNENQYIVELAIAGFKKEDVEITVEKSVLVIKGFVPVTTDSTVEYIYKGIGTRAFTKTIKLADTVVVRGAEFKDGILKIGLENVVPEEQKPRKVEIVEKLSFSQPELLKG